eukprot:1074963-Pyramimonas_sp.AAC.1
MGKKKKLGGRSGEGAPEGAPARRRARPALGVPKEGLSYLLVGSAVDRQRAPVILQLQRARARGAALARLRHLLQRSLARRLGHVASGVAAGGARERMALTTARGKRSATASGAAVRRFRRAR